MKNLKLPITSFLFFFLSLLIATQITAQINFIKKVGIGDFVRPESIYRLKDGNYIIGGTVEVTVDNTDAYIMKINPNGDTLWTKSFGGPFSDEIAYIDTTDDGGFIIAGTSGWGATNLDLYILKLDSSGDFQWSKTYGVSNNTNDLGQCIKQTADHGYIVLSTADQFYSVMVLSKIDSAGNLAWSKSYGNILERNRARSLIVNSDGGFTFTGEYDNLINSDRAIWLINTDSSGNVNWQKRLGLNDSQWQVAYSIIKSIDNGIFLLGDSGPSLIKTDSMGTVEWSKNYSINGGIGLSLKQLTNGNLLISGITDIQNKSFLINVDSSGSVNWSKNYNIPAGVSTFDGTNHNLETTADSGFIFITNTYNSTLNDRGILIFKTDSLGNIGCYDTPMNVNFTTSIIHDSLYSGNSAPYTAIETIILPNEHSNSCLMVSICYDNCQSIMRNTTITGPASVYYDSTYAYYITSTPPASSYTWTVPQGSNIISGQGTDTIIVHFDSIPGKICVYASDSCGINPLNCLHVGVGFPGTVWIGEINAKDNSSLSIFPNPTTGTIQLTFNTKHNGAVQCEIWNVMGERVFTSPLPAPLTPKGESARMEIDVSFLAKGIYVVRVGNDKSWENRKLVIE